MKNQPNSRINSRYSKQRNKSIIRGIARDKNKNGLKRKDEFSGTSIIELMRYK